MNKVYVHNVNGPLPTRRPSPQHTSCTRVPVSHGGRKPEARLILLWHLESTRSKGTGGDVGAKSKRTWLEFSSGAAYAQSFGLPN